jgi:hypothetical protein
MQQARIAEEVHSKPDKARQAQMRPRRVRAPCGSRMRQQGPPLFPYRAASIVEVQAMNDIPPIDRAKLAIWTVYDRPRDYPSNFVARMSLAGAGRRADYRTLAGLD